MTVTGPPYSICFLNIGITEPLDPKTLPNRVIMKLVRLPGVNDLDLTIISHILFEAPITLVGFTALSDEIITNVLTSKIEYHDSLDLHFGNIQYNAQFTVNTGGFENLKSRGFEIIANDTLRKAIIDLQDRWYDYLFILNEKNNTINVEQLLPVYRKHFTNLSYIFKDQYVSFTPINFESLRNNTDFLQLIAYQKFNNEQTLQYLEMIIDRIKDVIHKIQFDLNSGT